jgi:hypothetical protein
MKVITICICLAISLILITSCTPSVAKVEYDKVVNDLSAANSQSQTLQNQLSEAQTQNQNLQSQISSFQSKNEALQKQLSDTMALYSDSQTQLSNSQTQLKSIQSQNQLLRSNSQDIQDKIKKAKLIADTISSIFIPFMNGQNMTTSQQNTLFIQFTINIGLINDPQLNNMFKDIFDSSLSKTAQNKAASDIFNRLFQLESDLLKDISTQATFN